MPRTAKKPEAGTTSLVPLAELKLYERNPRKGNVGAIAASLRANGQYRPITANLDGTVLSGNHTLKAFRALAKKYPDEQRWQSIEVFWVDYDEDDAAVVVLAANKTSEKGGYDAKALTSLLGGLDGLEGTGFTRADLDAFTPPDISIPDDVDPLPDEETSGRGQAVISYSIVFDDADQRKIWTDFTGWLKSRDPDSSVGGRLAGYIESLVEAETEEL